MRFTMNVECTPEEARTFFGLPDVQPMQEALVKEMQDRMLSNIKAMDPDSLMRQWLPMSMQAYEQFQKLFWSGMSTAANTSDPQKKRG
jgi:hypothetical protein